MPDQKKILFLHIPKTAGQSIHTLLRDLFPGQIGPARVNDQLRQMSISAIRQHRVYSGHLDWALLDCLQGPRFAFTVLREPLDRILSFYFFLRAEAARATPEELNLPHNKGKQAALHLSCDEYFCSGAPMIRTFLDNHYDNFYAYYFAGRTYDARQHLIGRQRADKLFTADRVLEMALDNLATLDGVYSVAALDKLEQDLSRVAGQPPRGKRLTERRVNQGEPGSIESRMEKLRQLGATSLTFNRVKEMTVLDDIVWKRMCGAR